MREPTNADRSDWAYNALERFADKTGLDLATDDRRDAISDLLADLMHLCDRDGYDFGYELHRAQIHYDAEVSEA